MSDAVENDWQTAEETEFHDPAALAHLGRLDAVATDSAGIVDIDDGFAVTFRLAPCLGVTDVGDLIDRVAGSGARPIGLLDSLRCGPLDDPATRESLIEVAAGLGAYARQRGVPHRWR